MENIVWKISRFEELSVEELYGILHLRTDAFVMEQNVAYQDMDYKDQRAIHVHGYIDGKLVGYCRVFKAGDYFDEVSIGRVIIDRQFRGQGYAHDLMRQVLKWIETEWNDRRVTISAQAHLENFYEQHGFFRVGENYIEDTIPHVKMRLM